MTETTCRCGRPTRDNLELCDQCYDHLGFALNDVPFLVQELEVTLAKQHGAPIAAGPASAEQGLPYHPRAADVLRNLHGLLTTWVRFATEENVSTEDLPIDDTAALASWLFRALPNLRLHDIAPEAHDEITDAVADCRRLVFWRKRERTYLGTCELACDCPCHPDGECEGCACANRLIPEPCPGEVYADEGKPVGQCEECKRGHTVAVRRTELERRLDDRLCTPAEIARLTTYLGLDVARDQVRKRVLYWHRHKRITPASRDEGGTPMFRYGEVRTMLYREYATRDAG